MISVKGIVINSSTNAALDFVNITLTDGKNKLIASTNTHSDGAFSFDVKADSAYVLSIIYLGYQTKLIHLKGDADTDAGRILLFPLSTNLKEVHIRAAKSLIRQEVDRISYDVQADPESKTLNALEMLRKVPLLSVDAQDNIKLRGTGAYKILLNGRESTLLAKDPADILKAMPGTNIAKIEVITSPPAKYDAEGFVGIINIITAKKTSEGYSAAVNTSFNDVKGSAVNLNTTIKQGKFGFNGFFGAGYRKLLTSEFDSYSTFVSPRSVVSQLGDRGNGNKKVFAGTELSYEIDTLNLLTGVFNISGSHDTSASNQITDLFDAASMLTQAYRLSNNGTQHIYGIDAALNYQLGFKHHKDQLLTISYKYSENTDQLFSNVVTSQNGADNYRQYNHAGGKENTAQLDFVRPMKIVTIEAGGKMILRNTFSNFGTDTQNPAGAYATTPLLTNNFAYDQDVYGLYNSATVKLTRWVFKAGLRLERTKISGDFTVGEGFSRTYYNLIPSLSIQRVLNSGSLNLGFVQRIQRPGIAELNPFSNKANPLFITTGNPQLRPALNNGIQVSYSRSDKGSVFLNAFYAFSNNTIQSIATVHDNVTTQTFANTGKSKYLGLDVSINYPFTTRLSLNINGEVVQVWLDGFYNGRQYQNSGLAGYVLTNTSYKFDNGIRLGINFRADGRFVLLQGKDYHYFGNGFTVSRDFFNKKATLGLAVYGPFQKFNKLDYITRTEDYYSYSSNQNYYRTLGLTFNYKFGKLNSTIKKNQRGINNDDAAGGRG